MRTRRWPSLTGGMVLAGTLAITLLLTVGVTASQQPFTEWGWPTPYERVSTTSVDWLKAKGWWPVAIASQPPWPCANAVTTVMIKKGLLQQRGIESEAQWFLAGPPIIESVASGRTPVGFGGNFPFTSMLDKQVPVKAIALVTPNIIEEAVKLADRVLVLTCRPGRVRKIVSVGLPRPRDETDLEFVRLKLQITREL
jgi:hypothetical protein